jgi:hypothetical protein
MTTTTQTAEISFEEFVTQVLEKFPDKEWELGVINSSHGDRYCAVYENKEISYGVRPWGLTWEIFYFPSQGSNNLYSAPTLDEVQEQVW